MKFIISIVLASVLFVISSCKKEEDPKASGNPDPTTLPTVKVVKDVFVGGQLKGKAAYWKNGIPVTLGSSNFQSTVNAIVVVGNDVYAAGFERTIDYKYVAKYWKNGVSVNLTDGTKSAIAKDLVVVGSDVYVVGYGNLNDTVEVAKYWKNGVETNLSDGSTSTTKANAITVNGNDVYIVGEEYALDFTSFPAVYWKNGIKTSLDQGTAYDIQVFSGDVYIAGKSQGPKYWKNNVKMPLEIGSNNNTINNSYAFSLDVSGTNLYVAGQEYDNDNNKLTAKYWKNGKGVTLSTDTKSTSARAILVNGEDTYVAGYLFYEAQDIAKYWKNGVEQTLTNAELGSRANAIFLTY
jgi:hypothetical protein